MEDIEGALLVLVNLLADLYRERLENDLHVATGNLKSFTVDQEFDGQYYRISFDLPEYWKYVEEGGKPGKPSTADIEQWMNAKKITPRAFNGVVPTVKATAFRIARTIGEEGVPTANSLLTFGDRRHSLLKTLESQSADTITQLIKQKFVEHFYNLFVTEYNKIFER